MPLTYVTSFIDIYGDTVFEEKTIAWRFEKFMDLVSTGVQLCVYVCPRTEEYIKARIQEFSNVRMMKTVSISDTWVYKECAGVEYSLPEFRNKPKDIAEYMMLIHSKAEFLNDAIHKNPWKSTHFAWIDFSISYVFHDKSRTLEYIRVLGERHFEPEFLVIPGCWDKLAPDTTSQLTNGVYWRFCGGFLLGDAKSVSEMFDLYQRYFGDFLRDTRILGWEVNFWAWLEANVSDWNPRWYKGDHNDCIVHIPADVCALRLYENPAFNITSYPYPTIETYQPDSASYAFYEGKHILNTRYVNYWYLDSGHCSIQHPEDFIISKNLVSELDGNLEPIYYKEMQESTVGLPSKRCYFYGLEDIRLYELNGKLKFIATNIDYSPTSWNRMIVGEYHPFTQSYSNCKTVHPPCDSWCEKNWIPIVKPAEPAELIDVEEETENFIYKWNPLEIGEINKETNKLEIKKTYPILSPWFQKARGSTTFVPVGNYLLGIVHFSEDTLPRRYYHILVALDKDTFHPVKYSDIFVFQHIGIEFCIGFLVNLENYVFWISKMDREPKRVEIPVASLALKYDFV